MNSADANALSNPRVTLLDHRCGGQTLLPTWCYWEEKMSVKVLLPSNWPVGMSAGEFSWLKINAGRTSLLWAVPLLCVRKEAEQAGKQHSPVYLLQYLPWLSSMMDCNLKAERTLSFSIASCQCFITATERELWQHIKCLLHFYNKWLEFSKVVVPFASPMGNMWAV